MTMKFETQMSWAAQWEQEQLNKLIEDTKVYLRNKMAIDEPEEQATCIGGISEPKHQ